MEAKMASRGTSGTKKKLILALIEHLLEGGDIPSFASGGIAYGPQLAVVGDNPSGMEMMTPLGAPAGRGAFDMRNPDSLGGKLRAGIGKQNETMFGGARGQIGSLLSGGQPANPALGPNYARDALRRRALQTYGNQRRSADVLGKLYGLDPMQQRGALVNAEVGASGSLADAMNGADLEGITNYRDLLQRLLTGERGYQQNDINDLRQAQREKDARGSFLGNLAGQGVGIASGFIGGGRGRSSASGGWAHNA